MYVTINSMQMKFSQAIVNLIFVSAVQILKYLFIAHKEGKRIVSNSTI
jgi:hypothetical protein